MSKALTNGTLDGLTPDELQIGKAATVAGRLHATAEALEAVASVYVANAKTFVNESFWMIMDEFPEFQSAAFTLDGLELTDIRVQLKGERKATSVNTLDHKSEAANQRSIIADIIEDTVSIFAPYELALLFGPDVTVKINRDTEEVSMSPLKK